MFDKTLPIVVSITILVGCQDNLLKQGHPFPCDHTHPNEVTKALLDFVVAMVDHDWARTLGPATLTNRSIRNMVSRCKVSCALAKR